jgi:hypothetical protein
MKKMIITYFNRQTNAAPLAVFRVFFGLLMCVSIIRFWSNGWINSIYIEPKFHFSYYGFEWVKPLGFYTYVLFLVCGISALLVSLGYKYRLVILVFFLSFTYIELMDKTTYLNHYYFISVISFIMLFLPCNAQFSIDAIIKKQSYKNVPNWTIDSIKLMLGIVYFFAGITKINSDWLDKSMPLKLWLKSKYDLPYIGQTIMQQDWFHFFMSWGGMLYDLSIPFLLLYKKTRSFAFVLVVGFHIATRILFPIGMFPYIMIFSTIIFFDSKVHQRILKILESALKIFKIGVQRSHKNLVEIDHYIIRNSSKLIVAIFLLFQLLFPWRSLLYPGELFWTEEGYRFSWRVMLMEKAGATNFKVLDSVTKKYFYVNNDDFLTSFQQKQMSFQPDMILEYAHYLGNHFKSQGHKNVAVFVESYVSLNGRLSQQYIDPSVNLMELEDTFKHKYWITPLNDEIKGF